MTTEPTRFETWVFKVAPAACFVLAGFIWTSQAAQNAKEHEAFLKRIEQLDSRVDQHDIDLAVLASKDANEGKGL